MRNEAIVSDRNQFADERVRLDPAALTDTYLALYLDEWPNEAAISNCATIQIDWLYDGDVLTELNIDNP